QADIDTLSSALQDFSWDEDAGVFSYVLHDADGRPVERLRHPGGENYNLGLDGISPLFAGVCTPDQENRILERIFTQGRMWSPVGIVSVDQTTAYYREDGYWNGAVWFPYQWFLWKACLDLGRPDLAYRIAHTALEVWKREVDETYQCFEHFIVASGRGTGWHHFGGLSTPVLAWFSAYHRPGTLTCGFDTWIESLWVGIDQRGLRAELRREDSPRTWSAVMVLQPEVEYAVTWNGQPVEAFIRLPGTLEVS
ncbi:MAG TPA: trehalase family glycosidase, partial [Anaerolinea sp.]|nr:trehalase family glycosidase [Anaerolinea sp.]